MEGVGRVCLKFYDVVLCISRCILEFSFHHFFKYFSRQIKDIHFFDVFCFDGFFLFVGRTTRGERARLGRGGEPGVVKNDEKFLLFFVS